MCGLNFTWTDSIDAMQNVISHRGRVGCDHVYRDEGGACLGHVRLPIQGLGAEHDQPIYRHGIYWAFTGEFYNFREHDPEAECDAHVLIDLVNEGRVDALRDIDWMGNLVWYDPELDEVTLVTDFLAKKPLYIHTPTGSISSEIKALAILEGFAVETDELYFSSVSKWGYHIGDRTPYQNIRKVPPCTVMTINSEAEVTWQHQYDELRPKRGNIREAIERAVENRMVSDVPVSILLSGGLDSTIVYELAKRHRPDIQAVHIENNEQTWLSELSIENLLKAELLPSSDLDEILYYNEGPVDLGSMLAQYALAQALRGKTSVVITGDGADELFGGYRRSMEYDSQMSDIFEELVYYHLPRLDKLMMSATIEQRSPFLARDVIEMAMELPHSLRRNKNHLKDLFCDIVPPSILDRPKLPLKSRQVLSSPIKWRQKLIKDYRRIMYG